MLVRGAVRRREADLRQSILETYGFGGASVALVGFQIPRCALWDLGDDEPARDVGDPVAVPMLDCGGLCEGEGSAHAKSTRSGSWFSSCGFGGEKPFAPFVSVISVLLSRKELLQLLWLNTTNAIASAKTGRVVYIISPPPPLNTCTSHHITPNPSHQYTLSVPIPAMASDDTTPITPAVQVIDIHARNGVLQHPIPPAFKEVYVGSAVRGRHGV